ncbi:MAG: hypothetical protein R2769_13530 [Saprospiraceae bacterium]
MDTTFVHINDGKGNFSRDNEGIKDVIVCGFAIHAFDYDQDGDQDLIIGGRITRELPRNTIKLCTSK